MTQHLYAYGTLQVPTIIALIVGRELLGRPARLGGYARYLITGRPYPAIVEEPGGEVDGVVYSGLEALDIDRLDTYEGELYERRELPVQVGDITVEACTYVLCREHVHRLSREPWELARFEREQLASYLKRISRSSRAA